MSPRDAGFRDEPQWPHELRSPTKRQLLLHRIDPEQVIWRSYSLAIEQGRR